MIHKVLIFKMASFSLIASTYNELILSSGLVSLYHIGILIIYPEVTSASPPLFVLRKSKFDIKIYFVFFAVLIMSALVINIQM